MHVRYLVSFVSLVCGLLAFYAQGSEASTGIDTENDRVQGVAYREGSERGRSGCDWASVDVNGYVGEDRGAEAQTQVFDGVVHVLFQRSCPDGSVRQIFIPQLTVAAMLPGLRDEVEERLHYPEPVFQPVDSDGLTYVQVPIDFRTTAETWQPIVVTASVDGPPGLDPWVTITAQPTELWFASGDPTDPGLVAGCEGDAAVAPYVAETPGACSYVFRNASTTVDGDVFRAELGIAWEVTYESSDGSGTLTMDPTITPSPVRVGEIKGLVTCTGPDPRQGAC